MSRYERQYRTDWTALDPDEAVKRAYTLGVAAIMGESQPDELDALRQEMNSSYHTSLVELAFQEGKKEGREIDKKEEEAIWNELVVGEIPLEQDDLLTSGRSGLPEAMDITDAVDHPDRDSTGAVDLPEFLK